MMTLSDRTQNVRSVNALLSCKPTGTARTSMSFPRSANLEV